jgi:hypothetical protein
MSSSAALEGLLATLPEGTNPFLAIKAYLWNSLVPVTPASFKIQLICLAGGLGL